MIPSQDAPARQIIPVSRGGVTTLCIHAFLAAIAGLALRLFFALRFPFSLGDGDTYIQLARNWADHRIYGLWLNGQLIPTDLRLPGYPAFLAAVAIVFRRTTRAIVLSQSVLDLCTCFLAAALAAALAPRAGRRRAAIAGLWLAATCPFLANYAAAVLTEVLVAFFATGALLFFVMSLSQQAAEYSFLGRRLQLTPFVAASVGALLAGLASLIRPEMPLLLAAAGVVFAFRWYRSLGMRKILLAGTAMAIAFLLPLLPWAARNLISLHKLQISAPRYVTLPGEYATVGYFAWTNTWLERYRDVYLSDWKIGEEPVEMEDLPAAAFDSPEEKQTIATLFEEYNASPDLDITPEQDREFARIARQRIARHPFRIRVWVPFQRALTIWFTPRTELMPIDGKFWPVAQNWRDSHADVLTTGGFAVLGYLYVALALAGICAAWRARPYIDAPNMWGILLIVAYMIVRTAFLTTVEAPEPRYVVTCFPAVLALVALLWSANRKQDESI
jgi:hypothetical protein